MEVKDLVDVDFVDGKIVLALNYVHQYGEAQLNLKLGLLDVIKLAASKTDNKIDDKIVSLIEEALK